MARIELINLCKSFPRTQESDLDSLLNPVASFEHFMRWIRSGTSSTEVSASFVMENLNLMIPDGRIMVVLGPTGCGKSTLLRLIGGLLPPDSGSIFYDGVDVNDIPAGARQIGMVFQNYALYPHLTSRGNVLSYFLFKKQTPGRDAMAEEKYRKTSELLGVDIEYLMDKKPSHLSGGEKQRIALGRCITREPKLFLLDEPFSNLDQTLREKYRVQLKRLLRYFQITTVYVTHDQQEALILADSLTIMNVGSIEQVGTPEHIYHYPQSLFVAEFLHFDSDTPAINLFDGAMISETLKGFIIGVRPEDIVLGQPWESGPSLTGEVLDIRQIPVKNATVLTLRLGEAEITAKIPFNAELVEGDALEMRFRRYHLFDKHTGRRVQSTPEA